MYVKVVDIYLAGAYGDHGRLDVPCRVVEYQYTGADVHVCTMYFDAAAVRYQSGVHFHNAVEVTLPFYLPVEFCGYYT